MFLTKPLQAILFSVLLVITLESCKANEKVVEYGDEIIVFIESPKYASKYFVGNPVNFDGSAGTSNGFLEGEQLVWTSNIDGIIGYGVKFSRDDLAEGSHEITLTVVSESGESFQNSVPIELFKKIIRERHQIEEKKHIRTVVDSIDGGMYIDVGDGTIIDMTTGLMWEKSPDNKKRIFNDAIEYSKNLDLNGYVDWRLPTIEELHIISNIYLTEKLKNDFNLSDEAFVHTGSICEVFDTMDGHFWATQRYYTKIAKKFLLYTVEYRFDSSETRHFRSSPTLSEIANPGFVRCVRKCDLKKWRNVLTENKK